MLRFFPRTDTTLPRLPAVRLDVGPIVLPTTQRLGIRTSVPTPASSQARTSSGNRRNVVMGAPLVSALSAGGLALRLHTQPVSVVTGRSDLAALHRSTTVVTKRILDILGTHVEPLSALVARFGSTEHLYDLRQAGLTDLDDNKIAALRQSALVRGCRLVEDARTIGIDGVLRVATTTAVSDDGHWWGGPSWEASVDAFFDSGPPVDCAHQTLLRLPETVDDESLLSLLAWWKRQSRSPGRLTA